MNDEQYFPHYTEFIESDTGTWKEAFKCAVVTCSNIYIPTKISGVKTKFHDFPKNKQACIWKENCCLSQDTDCSHLKVCSDHFSLEDYTKNNITGLLKLIDVAVPHVNLNLAPVYVNVSNLDEPAPSAATEILEENKVLQQKLNTTEKKQDELITKINLTYAKILKKKQLIKKMESRKLRLQSKRPKQNYLQKVFSDTQINLLRGLKTIWTDDDLAMAFTLRHMSSKEFYMHLRDTLNMPLPGLGCVQKWCAKYNDE